MWSLGPTLGKGCPPQWDAQVGAWRQPWPSNASGGYASELTKTRRSISAKKHLISTGPVSSLAAKAGLKAMGRPARLP